MTVPLVVGATGLRWRLGLGVALLRHRAAQQTVPWERVARIAGEQVYLRGDSADVEARDSDRLRARPTGETPPAAQRAPR